MWLLLACAPHANVLASPANLASEAAFTGAVSARLAAALAPATVTTDGPLTLTLHGPDEMTVTVALERVLRLCRAQPAECGAELDRLAEVAKHTLSPERAAVTPAQLVETVRDETYVSTLVRTGGRPLATPLAADLYRVLMVDQPDATRIAMIEDLAALALPQAEVEARAAANTLALIGQVRDLVHALPPGTIGAIDRDSYYDCGLLLQASQWGEVAGLGSGTLVASVPGNDVLLYAWVNDDKELEGMKAATHTLYGRVERPVSERVLRWNGAAWEAAP